MLEMKWSELSLTSTKIISHEQIESYPCFVGILSFCMLGNENQARRMRANDLHSGIQNGTS